MKNILNSVRRAGSNNESYNETQKTSPSQYGVIKKKLTDNPNIVGMDLAH